MAHRVEEPMSARGRSSAVDRLAISSSQEAPDARRPEELPIHVLADLLGKRSSLVFNVW